MRLTGSADVTFVGNDNVMTSNCKDDSKCTYGGKSIKSQSPNLKFSVCKPGTSYTPIIYTALINIDDDLEKCEPLVVCTWSDITGNDIGKGTYSVPAPGCKMKKSIMVSFEVTINGEIGSYRELQSNRVDNLGVAATDAHRHFQLVKAGKLTLNYLKLTWGQAGGLSGGFIWMGDGNLAINWVHFDGSQTSGPHADRGGCIAVFDGTVTIKQSTFEGFRASIHGGAMYVSKTTEAMTIESTTFRDNEATVRFIFAGIVIIFFTSFCFEYFLFVLSYFFVNSVHIKFKKFL